VHLRLEETWFGNFSEHMAKSLANLSERSESSVNFVFQQKRSILVQTNYFEESLVSAIN